MTPERFRYLADAYGADIHRWPHQEQQAAQLLAAQHLPALDDALSQATLLDTALSAQALPYIDLALAERILAAAPQPASQPSIPLRAWWQRFQLAGVGLAGTALVGAGFAGAMVGALCVSIWTSGMLPESSADVQTLTADFVDLEQDWTAS